MTVKINNIDINAFRGIRHLEIPLHGKSLIIQGENGTGKSSIAEALEFFFTGEIAHLEGTQGLSTTNHGPHIHYPPKETNIGITFNNNSTPLFKTINNEILPPDNLKDYFETTQKGNFILRRSQILTFISTRPAERFLALASIMGVENLDDIELEMMRARDSLQGKLSGLEQDFDVLIAALSTTLEITIEKQEDIIPSINQKLKSEQMPEIKSFEDINKHTETMLKKVKTTQQKDDKIGRINELIGLTSQSLVPENIDIELKDYIKSATEFLNSNSDAGRSLSLENFLRNGKEILDYQKNDFCPLCEQYVELNSLNAKIETRLRVLKNLSGQASEIRKNGEILKTKINNIYIKLSEFLLRLIKIDELKKYKDVIEERKRVFKDTLDFIDKTNSLKEIIQSIKLVENFSQADSFWSKIQQELTKLIESTELTAKEKETLKLIRLLEQVKNSSNSISENQKKVGEMKFHSTLAEKIYETFSTTKNTKIQTIYDSIQGDIANFYSILHPNEPHGNIMLEVATGKRASTTLKMESYGRPAEDPRALASEGHLDSLGLCIFLGFVKNFNESCSLIILDDVVTTVDSSHREKICKILFEEFSNKQFLITTHDGIWYEQLCAHQRSYDLSNEYENLEIIKWDITTGPIIKNHKPRWDKITEKINEADKAGAANLSRQYLEYLILNIAVRFEVSAKVKMSLKYDVGDLFDPMISRFKKLLIESQLKTDIDTAIRTLRQTSIMGNLLSHHNPISENISIIEVSNFSNAVHKLAIVLQCKNCSKDLYYLSEIKAIRCSNKKCSNPQEFKTK